MVINGKEMSAKQFALEYVPTPEEFSTHTMVELYYKLEDIKTILDEYFDGATIDDLSDDEINAIMDIYDEYLPPRRDASNSAHHCYPSSAKKYLGNGYHENRLQSIHIAESSYP